MTKQKYLIFHTHHHPLFCPHCDIYIYIHTIRLLVCSSSQRHKSSMLYACMIGTQYVCSFVNEQLSLVEKTLLFLYVHTHTLQILQGS